MALTNQQIYLSLGIPAFMILANMSLMLFLFQSLNSRIDRLDSKVDRLDSKVDHVRQELTSRIDRVADATMTFYRELDKHENAITKHDEAIDKLQKK